MAKFTLNYRKAISAVGIGIKSTARQLDDEAPTITSGAGAPTEAEPDGSVFTQTDAGGALHVRLGGAWVQLAP